MLGNLYYSLVEQGTTAIIKNDIALELYYRENLDGDNITPSQDSGMYRTWGGNNDYLGDVGSLCPAASRTDFANFGSNLVDLIVGVGKFGAHLCVRYFVDLGCFQTYLKVRDAIDRRMTRGIYDHAMGLLSLSHYRLMHSFPRT